MLTNCLKTCVVILTVVLALYVQPSFAQETTAQETASPESTVTKLLDVLKDDAARAELIQQLEALTIEPEASDALSEDVLSIGRRIALVTQNVVQSTAQNAAEFAESLTNADSAFSGLRGDELAVLWAALPNLLVVIVITVAVFLILRRIAVPWFRRLGERAKTATLWDRISMFIGSNMVDALIVIIAWAIGYAVTVLVIGEFGQINIRQSMYLNAFLVVELLKTAIRLVLSPNAPGFRPVPLSDYAARSLTKTTSIVASVLGYGQLLVVPIVNQSTSYAAGAGISALLAAIVLVYLIYVVVRRRKRVAKWLVSRVDTKPADHHIDADTDADAEQFAADDPAHRTETEPHGVLASLAKRWHWFALAYLSAMFIISMTQPVDRVVGVVIGSAKIVVALVIASLLSRWLAAVIMNGITLPTDINQRLPLLEQRLNGFALKAFRFLRWTIMAITMFFILDIIGLIDMRSWLESQVGYSLTSTLATVLGIVFVAFFLWLAVTSWIDYRLNPDFGDVPTARETTLLSLFRNAATVTVIVLTLMFCLSELGLNIGPLLASAGVLGLAIGFGAQKMVQDIITGIFIQLENSIDVGDIITVGGITGGVEKLSVRSVSLREVNGNFHTIPFSSVDMVSNFSRDYSYYVCDMGVAYRENIDDVKAAMTECLDLLVQDPKYGDLVRDQLEWMGVEAFADSAVVVRARIKTVPGRQFVVGRAYNEILKRVFDERGIEIPFPHQTLYLGEAKDGSTQTFKLRMEES
ncbi:MAG: mechanosensitive ion channel [Silicimonas sp.]|nr:mechanosensitive ion channel [Silicimonas sp.]